MKTQQLCLLHMYRCVAVQLCVADLERHLDLVVLAVYCVALVCWRAPMRLPSHHKANARQQCQHAVVCGGQMCAECVMAAAACRLYDFLQAGGMPSQLVQSTSWW